MSNRHRCTWMNDTDQLTKHYTPTLFSSGNTSACLHKQDCLLYDQTYWPLCWLFSDIRILITSLVSANSQTFAINFSIVNFRQLKSHSFKLLFIMKQTVIVNNSTNINKTNSRLSCQTFEHDIGIGNPNCVLGHIKHMSTG